MTVRFDVAQLPRELARSEQVQSARPAPAVEQRKGVLAAAAITLNRRGLAAAKTELANAALLELAKLLYAGDDDGAPIHFDPATLRVLVPLPWGSNGYRAWGLRASEGRALRWVMLNRTICTDPAPWLDYDPEGRAWVINGRAYSRLGLAVAYLQTYPVTVQEWRAAAAATRTSWAKSHLDR